MSEHNAKLQAYKECDPDVLLERGKVDSGLFTWMNLERQAKVAIQAAERWTGASFISSKSHLSKTTSSASEVIVPKVLVWIPASSIRDLEFQQISIIPNRNSARAQGINPWVFAVRYLHRATLLPRKCHGSETPVYTRRMILRTQHTN